jgi:uncharacterized protein with HEPN domain
MQHDLIRIRHMLTAAKEAIEFAGDKTRKGLEKDRLHLLAIIKSIEIIGEAASKVSETFKTENSNIPWNDIISMRNRLIHVYFDVNLDIVWQTVKTDLPDLIKALEKIVPPEERI